MEVALTISGSPGDTVRIACTDAAQSLSSDYYTKNNRPVIGALITCESQGVRYAFDGIVPTQGAAGTGVGHILASGGSLTLQHGHAFRSFQFINQVNGSDAFIQVTPLYGV